MTDRIHIDFETYSEVDLKKVGTWAYSKHPSTEVICLAFFMEEMSSPSFLVDPEEIASFLLEIFSSPDNTIITAWNSFFELCICANVLGIKEALDVTQWEDTAALAAALALPRALGACGEALGLEQDKQKDKRGKYLIQRLSKPNRGKRNEDPDLLEEFYEYCRQDVVTEHAIAQRLKPLSPVERKVWELDQLINIRGVFVDEKAVKDAQEIIQKQTEKLNEEVTQLTSHRLTNVSQRQKVLDFVSGELGYSLIKFDKAYLSEVLKDEDLPPVARRLIEIRQQLGKTSTAKYAALDQLITDDSRAHGLLMYHGASTGRWSGKHFQPQNLPRPSFDDTETCIELFEMRDPEVLDLIYGDPMEALSSCVRGMICAPEGKTLIVADYAAIEARVLPWLAGQKDILNVFRSHGKIYEHTASQIYGVPFDEVTKDQRFIGKVATLALGYQGGAKAFSGMAESYGVFIEEETADQVKEDWRLANKNIVRYWWECDSAALKAVANPGKTFKVKNVAFRVINEFLYCKLPSGRVLAYYDPDVQIGKFDKEQVTFMGTNSVTRKWERQSTYGGKLVENITQAVARDLMAEAMLRLEQAGYSLVLSVHDELIAEVDESFGSSEEFEKIMCELPSWAEGLPVKAEGFEAKRYKK